MKIVHCPPNEDPLTYARQAARRGSGLAFLQGNGLIIALVVAMIVGTFTIGPLRPQPQQPEAPPATPGPARPTPRPVVYNEPVMCKLPAGGMIEAGYETFIADGETILKVRCEDDGTLQKATETTP